jgi:5'-3' exonuclease
MKKISSPFPTYDYIFVDTMNLASISYFAQTRLSWNGKPTGMLFGVLRQILFLKKKYPEAKIIFLWEGYNSIRKSKYTFYKSNGTSLVGSVSMCTCRSGSRRLSWLFL